MKIIHFRREIHFQCQSLPLCLFGWGIDWVFRKTEIEGLFPTSEVMYSFKTIVKIDLKCLSGLILFLCVWKLVASGLVANRLCAVPSVFHSQGLLVLQEVVCMAHFWAKLSCDFFHHSYESWIVLRSISVPLQWVEPPKIVLRTNAWCPVYILITNSDYGKLNDLMWGVSGTSSRQLLLLKPYNMSWYWYCVIDFRFFSRVVMISSFELNWPTLQLISSEAEYFLVFLNLIFGIVRCEVYLLTF